MTDHIRLRFRTRLITLGITATLLVHLIVRPVDGEETRSPLQIGAYANPFWVRDCTGPAAGKTLCYYCRYADRPVVALFVRDITGDVERLLTQVDSAVADHQRQRMAAFVVLLEKDTQTAEKQLKALSKRLALKHTPLTIYRDQPTKLKELYRLSPTAAVTAMAWKKSRITVNRSFPTTRIEEHQRHDFLKQVRQTVTDGS